MAGRDSGSGMLRDRQQGDQPVTYMELFFDLVYVFAVTQLAHLLLASLSLTGALQTLLMLLAVWWAWMYTAWATNWFDPDNRVVRGMLVAIMLLSLVMSAALPEAFGARGLAFAGAYAAMQVGRSTFAVLALRREPALRRNFQRILAWQGVAALLWLGGGMLPGTARNALWVAAVVVDYVGPAAGFFTPGLGRSTTADWTIAGGHLAERCQQFLIIALGESVLDTGVALSGGAITPGMVGAVVVAFAGNVALWWIYFDRGAGDSSAIILRASDPGRLGRSAYTYFHLPMVAGVIVTAVADEWTVAHPTQVSGAAALTILGGPVLFLVGHFLFKRAIFGKVAVSRLVAIVALAVLMPIGLIATPLALALAATLILAAVAWWDTRHHVADAR